MQIKKEESVIYNVIEDMVNEEFCFLVLGHLLPGTKELEDRKNIGLVIKTFIETLRIRKTNQL